MFFHTRLMSAPLPIALGSNLILDMESIVRRPRNRLFYEMAIDGSLFVAFGCLGNVEADTGLALGHGPKTVYRVVHAPLA